MSDTHDSIDETEPGDLPHADRRSSKLLRLVMRQVAHELRDDPAFTNPVIERMAERIIGHAFTLFAKWLGILAMGSIVSWALIWLGMQGAFTK